MRRDMELIRGILLKVEQDIHWEPRTYTFPFGNTKLTIESHSDDEVYGHLVMLLESPLLEGKKFSSGEIAIKAITWEGREFLDSVRDSGNWKKTKAAVERLGGVGLSVVSEIAKGVIKSEAAKLGLNLS